MRSELGGDKQFLPRQGHGGKNWAEKSGPVNPKTSNKGNFVKKGVYRPDLQRIYRTAAGRFPLF